MKYNEKKLNTYWKRRDEIRANWRHNGWNKDGPHGRDFTYPCGHSVWAGYGISDEWLKKRGCHECKYPERFKD